RGTAGGSGPPCRSTSAARLPYRMPWSRCTAMWCRIRPSTWSPTSGCTTGCEREAAVSRVAMNASVSLDGFIARPHHSVGPLFDRYGNGDTEFNGGDPDRVFRISRASADYLGRVWPTFAV